MTSAAEVLSAGISVHEQSVPGIFTELRTGALAASKFSLHATHLHLWLCSRGSALTFLPLRDVLSKTLKSPALTAKRSQKSALGRSSWLLGSLTNFRRFAPCLLLHCLWGYPRCAMPGERVRKSLSQSTCQAALLVVPHWFHERSLRSQPLQAAKCTDLDRLGCCLRHLGRRSGCALLSGVAARVIVANQADRSRC